MTDRRDDLHVETVDRPGPPPELKAAAPRRSHGLGVLIATVALAAFAGVVWYAYDRGLQRGAEVTAPLIKADPRPVKVRPESEGGLQVPNQDKLVFEAMRPGESNGQRVERLLPPPETPVEPPKPPPLPAPVTIPTPVAPPDDKPPPSSVAAAPAGDGATVPIPDATSPPAPTTAGSGTSDIPPARVVSPAPKPLVPPPPQPELAQPTQSTTSAPPPPPAPAVEAKPAPAPAPATPAPVAQAPQPKAEPNPPPAPTPAPQTAARPAGEHRVQLGAFRDEAAARREWTRLLGRYPDLLTGLTLRVQRVDLGAAKGVFHRVQGGLVSAGEATRVCDGLKERGQACLVVRP